MPSSPQRRRPQSGLNQKGPGSGAHAHAHARTHARTPAVGGAAGSRPGSPRAAPEARALSRLGCGGGSCGSGGTAWQRSQTSAALAPQPFAYHPGSENRTAPALGTRGFFRHRPPSFPSRGPNSVPGDSAGRWRRRLPVCEEQSCPPALFRRQALQGPREPALPFALLVN